MTSEQFEEWIDAEITKYTKLEDEEFYNEAIMNNYLGQIAALERVKTTYRLILPPPTTLN